MSTVPEIEEAIRHLSPAELTLLRRWFAEFDGGHWDAQFESDASNGRLDALASEARDDLDRGRCTNL